MEHFSHAAAWRTWTWRTLLLSLPMVALGLVAGCNPASLAFLMMPFVDNNIPAKCKLADPSKEVTVAIVTWFGNTDLQLYPELMPFDNELSEKLAGALRDRYAMTKDKVKVVPNHQVRVYQNKVLTKTWSPADLGKKVKADYVIAMEIRSLSLYERGGYNQLYRGTTEVDVNVYDLRKPEKEQVVFSDIYQRAYPKDNPLDASGSVLQFRALFLRHVTRDLSRWFAAYSQDERIHNMEQD